jgi:hypothetical protein
MITLPPQSFPVTRAVCRPPQRTLPNGMKRRGRDEELQVVRGETGVLGDAGRHAGTDLFAIVEREDKVGPVRMGENPVGAGGVPLQTPANSEKSRQNLTGFS